MFSDAGDDNGDDEWHAEGDGARVGVVAGHSIGDGHGHHHY